MSYSTNSATMIYNSLLTNLIFVLKNVWVTKLLGKSIFLPRCTSLDYSREKKAPTLIEAQRLF